MGEPFMTVYVVGQLKRHSSLKPIVGTTNKSIAAMLGA